MIAITITAPIVRILSLLRLVHSASGSSNSLDKSLLTESRRVSAFTYRSEASALDARKRSRASAADSCPRGTTVTARHTVG